MNEELDVKVTRIKNKFHARLLKNGKVIDEMACDIKEDIGFICREMLRWYDKLGGSSKFASAARHRQIKANPTGKIYYRKDLEND